MLLKLFGAWRRHFLLKWLFLLICLVVLWTFTLVTGMAPSTQRAATMFSVLILADTLLKQHSTVNSLAVSAFVILWVEPYQLYSVGFQLSFLALGGILDVQPWIVGWWKVENRLLRYFWELSTVSFSAQLAVLPLSIYYFHQLPVYFLLSNMFLIPLAFCIVVFGVIFFLSSLIPTLMSWMAIPLKFLTQIAGYVVQTVADFPVSTLQGIQIGKYELFFWYGILGLGVVFLKTRQKLPWLLCLWLFAGLTLNSILYCLQSSVRKQIVFFHIPGHTAVDFISGMHFQSLMDPELASDHREVEYNLYG
jgi:competence protein ComEC